MELWFERAIAHPAQRYQALQDKLWYLEPRWYGTERECLEFAREILKSDDFRGECPLHLYHLHESLASFYGERRPNYWLESHVWPDIQASFDRYYSFPNADDRWRQAYARSAYYCRQWKILKAELAKIDNPDYAYFGGREAYEAMRKEAEARARE